MSGQRRLIVNADDFGQSDGVNHGILRAHEHGIVTSASLMVRWPEAAPAAQYATVSELDLGLHIDLGEWEFAAGEWTPLYEVVDLDDADAVLDEIRRQTVAFVDLVGRPPTHLDSHQHVHRRPAIQAAAEQVAHYLQVPLRDFDPRVQYVGNFYGQTADGAALDDSISVDALIAILEALPEGITELGCHPGLDIDLATMYRSQREVEVATLCDPRVRKAIDTLGIQLCSFAVIE